MIDNYVVESLLGLVMTVFGFFVKRLVNRVDANEEKMEMAVHSLTKDINGIGEKLNAQVVRDINSYATKVELRESHNDLRSTIEEMRRELRQDFATTWEKLDRKADK